jgi:hypothetical protein
MKLESFTGSNATHCSPSSTLTHDILEECRKMLANPPMPRADHFVSPRAMEALRRESTPSPDPISRMLGMDVFVMEDQKADAWVITDPHIAAAYRKGEISEDVLKRMSDRIAEIRASQENDQVVAPPPQKPENK